LEILLGQTNSPATPARSACELRFTQDKVALRQKRSVA